MKKLILLLTVSFCFTESWGCPEIHLNIRNDNSCTKSVGLYYRASCNGGPWGDWTATPFQSWNIGSGTSVKYDFVAAYSPDCCNFEWKIVLDWDKPTSLVVQQNLSTAEPFVAVLGGDPTICTNTVEKDDKGDGGCGNSSGCSGGCAAGGMPVWEVSEPYVNLKFRDEPLGYQPVQGDRISLELAFKQREFSTGLNTNLFSVGKRWNFSWLSFVTLTGNGKVVHLGNGQDRTFQGTNDYLTNTRLTGATNTGFTLSYPDGSQDIYGFIVTNSTGAFLEAFRTEHRNAQSQKTIFSYDSYTPGTSPVIRLRYVVDGDGRTNTVSYVTSGFSTNLISRVVDAFGRTNFLAYDNSGHLTNVIDVAGISSSFGYRYDVITNLTTPYGSTIFQTTSATNARSVLITQPDGGHQLYLYQSSTPGLAVTNHLPNTSPFSNTLDNTNLDLRNSFYWGPRQYAALSTTNIASFTTNDFLKARMKHWLVNPFHTPGDTISMVREPSPDSGGMIEGQKTWYDYTGKTNNAYEGTQVLPLFVAQVLPDGTTRFTRSLRNSFGAVTNEISTYSTGGN
jgi:hypothetical protein